MKQALRGLWDTKMQSVTQSKVLPAPPALCELQNQLLLFYSPTVDQERMVNVSATLRIRSRQSQENRIRRDNYS